MKRNIFYWIFMTTIVTGDPISLVQRPVIVFHGMMMSCRVAMMQGFENLNYRCLETGENLQTLRPVSKQGKSGCKLIKKMISTDPSAFKNGFYILGFSLGGLIGRWILHFCNLGDVRIKRLITSSSPNMGIKGIPNIKSSQLKSVFYDAKLAMKDMIVAAGAGSIAYQGIIDPKAKWDEKFSLIELYNIFSKKAAIIQKFENDPKGPDIYKNLEFFGSIASRDDALIKPFSSATFGVDYNKTSDNLDLFTKTKQYKQNYLGLAEMYDKGTFMICLNYNQHNNFTPKAVLELNALLSDDCTFDQETFSGYNIDDLYELCLYKKIATREDNSEIKCQPGSKTYLEKPEVVQNIAKITRKKRRLMSFKRIRRRAFL